MTEGRVRQWPHRWSLGVVLVVVGAAVSLPVPHPHGDVTVHPSSTIVQRHGEADKGERAARVRRYRHVARWHHEAGRRIAAEHARRLAAAWGTREP
ncbi:MAG: hypothetical protein HYV02_04520 [Deltaproteobacteria bacterium]|nr:hypothetical protein [Deltaproteobacteria bacterium]